MRSCVALYGKTAVWRVKKVTACFEMVSSLAALRGERYKSRLTSLRDEWRRNLHRSPRKAELLRAKEDFVTFVRVS